MVEVWCSPLRCRLAADRIARHRRRILLSSATLALYACSGDKVNKPPTVTRVEISPSTFAIPVGATQTLTARALDNAGAVVPNVQVTWVSTNEAVATVASFGVVTGVAVGQATVTATVGKASASAQGQVTQPRVARIALTVAQNEVLVGGQTTATAVAYDVGGNAIVGWTPTWTSADSSIARVDGSGVVRGVGPGTVTIRVQMDTAVGVESLRIRGAVDVRVAQLTFVQSIQDDRGTIPMIRDGLPVAVNVWATADALVAVRGWLAASCSSAGQVVWTDSSRVDDVLLDQVRSDVPTAQFIVPNARLAPAMECTAEFDRGRQVSDTLRANNRFPRTGTLAVDRIDVPPLDVTFVPVTLTADGNVTGNVTTGNLGDYLVSVRQMLPVGVMNARVGAPLVSGTLFGGGAEGPWRSLLRELEARRVLDGSRSHYYGVVRPAPNITFVQFGGFGFVFGRTALGIQVGWFNRESQARETVAHELGHNFGRLHAPCGGPANPDPEFPYADGVIGVQGWDVASSVGTSARASIVAPGSRDLMSYCRPVWVSDYTYRGMIAGRAQLAASGEPMGASGSDAILVRGEIAQGSLTLDPLFLVEGAGLAEPTDSPLEAATIEALSADGTVVGTVVTRLKPVDHGDAKMFVAMLPVPRGTLVRGVRVGAKGRSATRVLQRARDVAPRVTQQNGATVISWDAAAASDVLVRDAATGTVLAFAQGGLVRLPNARLPVHLSFSNGTRARDVR